MAPEQRGQPASPGMRYAGLGMELAGGIAGFTLLGYWLDVKFDTHPRWLTVGAVIGCVGGMYNLIKIGIQESKRAVAPRPRDESGEKPDDGADDTQQP